MRLYRTASVLPYCATCRIGLSYFEEPWPPPLLVRKAGPPPILDWTPHENPPEPYVPHYRPRRTRPRWAVGLSYSQWKREEREREDVRKDRQRELHAQKSARIKLRFRCWTLEGFADTTPPDFAQSDTWPPQFHIPAFAYSAWAEMSEIGEPDYDRYPTRWTET